MLTMKCKTCGRLCDRHSNSQKFCADCSPEKRRLDATINPRKCTKCQTEFMPNSNRQKYCRECSPHFTIAQGRRRIAREYKPSTTPRKMPAEKIGNLPEKICCRCGASIGFATRRNISSWRLREEPCEKCRPIKERQEKASAIKCERKHKKRQSRFGKWLLLEEEKNHAKNAKARKRLYPERLYNRMRYVSEEEIMCKLNNGIPLVGNWFEHYRGVPVFRNTQWTGYDYIYEAGFYRVEPSNNGCNHFTQVCACGIPTWENNYYVKMFNNIMTTKAIEAQKTLEEKRWQETRLELTRKPGIVRAAITQDSSRYFQSMAMVAAVRRKEA